MSLRLKTSGGWESWGTELQKHKFVVDGVDVNPVRARLGSWLFDHVDIDTSQLVNASSLFDSWLSLTQGPELDLSSATTARLTFSTCTSLVETPDYEMPVCEDVTAFFQNCYALTSPGEFTISVKTNLRSLFNGCGSMLTAPSFSGISQPVKETYALFANCTALTVVPDIPDLSEAENVAFMFSKCENLETIPVDEISAPMATTGNAMFQINRKLTYGPKLNLPNVTAVSHNFTQCGAMTGAGGVIAPKATTAAFLYYACGALEEIGPLDLRSATVLTSMLQNCTRLRRIGAVNLSSATNIDSLFYNMPDLESIESLTLSPDLESAMGAFSWFGIQESAPIRTLPSPIIAPNLTNGKQMFYVTRLESLAGSSFTGLQNASYMFADSLMLTELPELGGPLLDAAGMFAGCESLPAAPMLDTSRLTDMASMFMSCSALTSVPLYDTSGMTNMDSTFQYCTSLTGIPEFDTSSVTNMTHMFAGCSSLTTIPALNTSAVTNMRNMFANCSSLTEVPALDTSSVTNMDGMFVGCSSLTTVPTLDTSSATNMSYMFANCTSLTEIPALDMSQSTDNFWFAGSPETPLASLTSIKAYGATRAWGIWGTQLDATALNEVFTNLGVIAEGTQYMTLNNNPGDADCDPSIATAKGWTVKIGDITHKPTT